MFLLPHRYRGPSIFFTTRSVYHTNKKNARKIYTFFGCTTLHPFCHSSCYGAGGIRTPPQSYFSPCKYKCFKHIFVARNPKITHLCYFYKFHSFSFFLINNVYVLIISNHYVCMPHKFTYY